MKCLGILFRDFRFIACVRFDENVSMIGVELDMGIETMSNFETTENKSTCHKRNCSSTIDRIRFVGEAPEKKTTFHVDGVTGSWSRSRH